MLLELKAKKVIKDLKRVITNNELNLQKIFMKLDKNGNGNLDFSELRVLLKNIDKGLTENEIKIVFDVFDSNKDKEVNFQEFESAIFPNNSQNTSLVHKTEQITQHTSAFLQKIKNTVITNELDLNMIFSHFDTDKNKSLDLKEFGQFIKVVQMKADP